MMQTNYSVDNSELDQYFLEHRGDQAAFQAYLGRTNSRPRRIIASPDDPGFDKKLQAAIRQKLTAAISRSNQQANNPMRPD